MVVNVTNTICRETGLQAYCSMCTSPAPTNKQSNVSTHIGAHPCIEKKRISFTLKLYGYFHIGKKSVSLMLKRRYCGFSDE